MSERIVLTHDPEQFAAVARPYLDPRLECNVMVTVLINVLDGVITRPGRLFAYGLDDRDQVRWTAFRTPPWLMLASGLDARSAPALLERWLPADPELPGVNGVPETAGAVAAAYTALTGRPTRIRMHEAMHVLERVEDPPQPAAGSLRVARSDERALLVEWMRAFGAEAGLSGGDFEALVDGRMIRDGMFVWEDGDPVSVLGVAPEVAGAVRIGPVYTPPEFRRRGYAGTAVAAASRQALAQGAQRCTLFTDLENPTSNKIYAEVGYRRVGDWEEHAFG